MEGQYKQRHTFGRGRRYFIYRLQNDRNTSRETGRKGIRKTHTDGGRTPQKNHSTGRGNNSCLKGDKKATGRAQVQQKADWFLLLLRSHRGGEDRARKGL